MLVVRIGLASWCQCAARVAANRLAEGVSGLLKVLPFLLRRIDDRSAASTWVEKMGCDAFNNNGSQYQEYQEYASAADLLLCPFIIAGFHYRCQESYLLQQLSLWRISLSSHAISINRAHQQPVRRSNAM
jgi:hypothetical protein